MALVANGLQLSAYERIMLTEKFPRRQGRQRQCPDEGCTRPTHIPTSPIHVEHDERGIVVKAWA